MGGVESTLNVAINVGSTLWWKQSFEEEFVVDGGRHIVMVPEGGFVSKAMGWSRKRAQSSTVTIDEFIKGTID